MSSRCVGATAPWVPRQPDLGILVIVVPAHLTKTRLKKTTALQEQLQGGEERRLRGLELGSANQEIWRWTTTPTPESVADYSPEDRKGPRVASPASRGSFDPFNLRISADWSTWGETVSRPSS